MIRSVVRNVVRSVTRDVTTPISRFFTEFLSSVNSYATPLSTPTVTRLVMDVYPINGNTGLPAGAPAVTSNVFQTIDFAFVGTMPEIGRNGANYFDGFIANIYAYDGPTLVGFWPMDDAPTSSVFRDASGNGNDLTKQNIASDQTELFDKVDDGWTGVELALINTTPLLGDTSDPEFSNIVISAIDLTAGNVYRISATVNDSPVANAGQTVGWTTNSGIPLIAPFRIDNQSAGDIVGGDYVCTTSSSERLFGRALAQASFKDITAKRLLEVA